MNFEVRAVSGDDYDAYLDARQSGMTTAEALESIGQPGHATTTKPFPYLQKTALKSAGG
jgi:cytochrome c oxidase subunit II